MTTNQTRLSIVVSTGAEINKQGDYCLYLVVKTLEDGEQVDIDSGGVLTSISSSPDDLDVGAAIAAVTADYSGEIPECVEWAIDRGGVPDHNGNRITDGFGGYTVAEITFPVRRSTGNLYDANTAAYIGPATPEQVTASDASDSKGECGYFLIDQGGKPVEAGSWDALAGSSHALRPGVRRVYTL